jgi:hypothetical protein
LSQGFKRSAKDELERNARTGLGRVTKQREGIGVATIAIISYR